MRDEQDVCKIVQAVSQFQNPFQLDSVPSKLINIATGQVASDQVGNSLKSFLDDGRKILNDFVRHRRLQSGKSKSFWDPASRSKLLPFSEIRKSVEGKKAQSVTFDSEVLFLKIAFISKERNVNLESILLHELAPVLPSLL